MVKREGEKDFWLQTCATERGLDQNVTKPTRIWKYSTAERKTWKGGRGVMGTCKRKEGTAGRREGGEE